MLKFPRDYAPRHSNSNTTPDNSNYVPDITSNEPSCTVSKATTLITRLPLQVPSFNGPDLYGMYCFFQNQPLNNNLVDLVILTNGKPKCPPISKTEISLISGLICQNSAKWKRFVKINNRIRHQRLETHHDQNKRTGKSPFQQEELTCKHIINLTNNKHNIPVCKQRATKKENSSYFIRCILDIFPSSIQEMAPIKHFGLPVGMEFCEGCGLLATILRQFARNIPSSSSSDTPDDWTGA